MDDNNMSEMQVALIAQAGYGNLVKIKELVEDGARLAENKDQIAYAATNNGQLNIVKFLVENFGDDLYEEVSQKQFVDIAAKCGHNEVINYFIEQGFNANEQGGDALVHAAENGQIDSVKFLLGKGADIHHKDDSALKWAAANGKTDTVKFLAEQGANIFAKDQDALRYSSKSGHTEVALYLIDKGCDPKIAKELATTEVANAVSDHEREKFAARLQFKVPHAKKASQSRLKI